MDDGTGNSWMAGIVQGGARQHDILIEESVAEYAS